MSDDHRFQELFSRLNIVAIKVETGSPPHFGKSSKSKWVGAPDNIKDAFVLNPKQLLIFLKHVAKVQMGHNIGKYTSLQSPFWKVKWVVTAASLKSQNETFT